MSINTMKLALEALENASPAAWASRVDSDTMKSIWRKHAEALEGLQALLAELDNAACKSVQKRLAAQPPAQATQAEVTGEREAFESCALMEGSLFKRRADDPDKYWDGNVQDDWELWQARAQVQGEPFGYIHHFAAHDESGALIDTTWEADGCADPLPHPTFPSTWKWAHCTPFYTTPQPAQATQAEVTDSMIREAFLANGFTIKDGHSDLKPYVYAAARAILALRHERVPMTPASRDVIMATRTANADADEWPEPWAYQRGWNNAEAHHGISAQAKKEGV